MRLILILAIMAIFVLALNGNAAQKAYFDNVKWPKGTYTTSDSIVTCTSIKSEYTQNTKVWLVITFKGPNSVKYTANAGQTIYGPGKSTLCQGWNAARVSSGGRAPPGKYEVSVELRENSMTGKKLDSKSGGSFKLA